MTVALSVAALRHRTTTSTVLFAVVNAVLARMAGVDALTMNVVAANRYAADTRSAIGTFSQLVPVTVRTGRQGPAELIRQAGVASVKAMMRGAYDPCSLDRLRAEVPRELTLSFNDISRTVAPAPDPGPLDGAPRGKAVWETRTTRAIPLSTYGSGDGRRRPGCA